VRGATGAHDGVDLVMEDCVEVAGGGTWAQPTSADELDARWSRGAAPSAPSDPAIVGEFVGRRDAVPPSDRAQQFQQTLGFFAS